MLSRGTEFQPTFSYKFHLKFQYFIKSSWDFLINKSYSLLTELILTNLKLGSPKQKKSLVYLYLKYDYRPYQDEMYTPIFTSIMILKVFLSYLITSLQMQDDKVIRRFLGGVFQS